MGNILSANTPSFAHHNLSVRAVGIEGANAGRQFTFESPESVSCKPGNKVKALMGLSAGPLSVISGGAEPSFKLKLSKALESALFGKFMGHIHNRFTITATFKRIGIGVLTYKLVGCLIEDGLGFDSSQDGGPVDEISGKMTDLKIRTPGASDYISVVHPSE